MKILFLTPLLPYPAISGGLIKTLKMIQFLSQSNLVEVGFFIKENSQESREHLEEFSDKVGVKYFFEYLNIERSALNFIKSIFNGIPMSVYRNKSISFNKLCDEKAINYDLVFVDHFLMHQYVPKNWEKKIILHQHNAEFLMWKRFAETQSSFLKKMLIRFESLRIKKYEKFIIENSSSVLASPNDIEILSQLTNKKDNFVETLHLGEEYLLSEADTEFEKTKKNILYIGTLSWEANKEGLVWFLRNVWPKVLEKHPDVMFDIIGKENDDNFFQEWKSDKRIRWHGFVEDLKPFYNDSRVFVAPLNFGSGIKVKVINALYRGIPTVTTSIGVEGLILKNNQDILVSNDSEEQFEQVSSLLTNKILWEKISKQSRLTARKLYSWESVLEKINKVVNNG